MKKEVVGPYFMILSQNLAEKTMKNHNEKLQLRFDWVLPKNEVCWI
jgi:hypothetical protein